MKNKLIYTLVKIFNYIQTCKINKIIIIWPISTSQRARLIARMGCWWVLTSRGSSLWLHRLYREMRSNHSISCSRLWARRSFIPSSGIVQVTRSFWEWLKAWIATLLRRPRRPSSLCRWASRRRFWSSSKTRTSGSPLRNQPTPEYKDKAQHSWRPTCLFAISWFANISTK